MSIFDSEDSYPMTAGSAAPQQPSVYNQLIQEKERLETRLGQINAAIEQIDANPQAAALFEALSKVSGGRFL